MSTTRKSATTKGGTRSPAPKDGSVRVWSSVGITLCVTDDPPQFLKYEFGHERIAKSGTTEEIKRVAAVIDEFNSAELEKRISQYQRLVKAHGVEVGESDPEPRKGSVKERARKRLAEADEEDDDTWD